MNASPTKSKTAARPVRDHVILHGAFPPDRLDLIKDLAGQTVVVPEGRPDLATAQALCRDLLSHGLRPTVIADNMAGFLFYQGRVREVWLAYEEGDREGVLCDIGALILAVLARHHRVPVFACPSGNRARRLLARPQELLNFNGTRIAPRGVDAYVPLKEWVPGTYVRTVYE